MRVRATSLPLLAARAAEESPGAAGFLVPEELGFRPIAYRSWWEQIEKVAAGLRGAGLGPGDRVLLMMETRYEWLVSDLAILTLGAWTVPVYPNLPAAQLTHMIEDARPSLAILSRPELLDRLLQVPRVEEAIRTVFLLEGGAPARCSLRVLSLRRLLEGPLAGPSEREELRLLRERIEPSDPATILYTSGTSANPKGVVLTHENILSNARMILASLLIGPRDRLLSILPLAHILERTTSYTAISVGATIAYGRGIESFARDAAAVHPTVLVAVPRLFEQILAAARAAARARGKLALRLFGLAEAAARRRGRRGPGPLRRPDGTLRPPRGIAALWERLFYRPLRERLGDRLRLVISGSAPLGRQEAFFFCGIGLPLLEGYGLTEAGPVVSVSRFDAWRAGSVGRPLEGVEVAIAEDGELLVKSPSVMVGYLNLEAESREALRGGWLHTGDLGSIDAEGIVTVTGRKKDMIVTSGGKNIAPAAIEERLRRSPIIEEAVVFGDRRPHLVALLVPDRKGLDEQLGAQPERRGSDPLVRALFRKEVDRVNQHLAPHERVRSFDLLEEPFSIEAGTLTPTLKVRRGLLEALYADQIAALYDRPRR